MGSKARSQALGTRPRRCPGGGVLMISVSSLATRGSQGHIVLGVGVQPVGRKLPVQHLADTDPGAAPDQQDASQLRRSTWRS